MTREPTRYNGWAAFRISDGRTEAIVVPALSGRVMRYGRVGGPNALWNSPRRDWKPGEWRNWGGDKAWPAPQSAWPLYSPQGGWPPHPTFDGLPHRVQTPDRGALLRTVGPLMIGLGVRATRDYRFDAATGALVITTTLRKEAGDEPRQVGAWHVTQVPPPDAVFLPLNPRSPYKNNFYWFGGAPAPEARITPLSPTLLRFRPTGGGYKIGVDAPAPALAAVRNGVALLQRAARKPGAYPEGAEGSGFPITLWNQGDPAPGAAYVETEMLSPLQILRRGESLTHTVRWSLHDLPERDAAAPAVQAAVERLLRVAL